MYNDNWINAPDVLVSDLLRLTYTCNFSTSYINYILGYPAFNKRISKTYLKDTLYCYELHAIKSDNGELLIWEPGNLKWQQRSVIYTMGSVTTLNIYKSVAMILGHIPLSRFHEFVNNLGIMYDTSTDLEFLRFYLSNLTEFDDLYDDIADDYNEKRVDDYISNDLSDVFTNNEYYDTTKCMEYYLKSLNKKYVKPIHRFSSSDLKEYHGVFGHFKIQGLYKLVNDSINMTDLTLDAYLNIINDNKVFINGGLCIKVVKPNNKVSPWDVKRCLVYLKSLEFK